MILTAVPTALTLRFSINIDRYFTSKSIVEAIQNHVLPPVSVLRLGVIDAGVGCTAAIKTIRVNGQKVDAPLKAPANSDYEAQWIVKFPTTLLSLPINPGTGANRPSPVAQQIEVDVPVCPIAKF